MCMHTVICPPIELILITEPLYDFLFTQPAAVQSAVDIVTPIIKGKGAYPSFAAADFAKAFAAKGGAVIKF